MDLHGVEKREEKKIPRKAENKRYQKHGFWYSDGSVHSACEPCRLVWDLQFSGDGLSYGRRAVAVLYAIGADDYGKSTGNLKPAYILSVPWSASSSEEALFMFRTVMNCAGI